MAVSVTGDEERSLLAEAVRLALMTEDAPYEDIAAELLAPAGAVDRIKREAAAEALRGHAYRAGEWCGECVYGEVMDPPCCTKPARQVSS